MNACGEWEIAGDCVGGKLAFKVNWIGWCLGIRVPRLYADVGSSNITVPLAEMRCEGPIVTEETDLDQLPLKDLARLTVWWLKRISNTWLINHKRS